jgi:hypothetical protein
MSAETSQAERHDLTQRKPLGRRDVQASMRLFRRLQPALPHGPTSAGGLADLGLVVPEDSATSRRREAVALYLVPLALLGVMAALDLGRHRDVEELSLLFVLSMLVTAGAVAASMKRWQAGLPWRGAIVALLSLAMVMVPWSSARMVASTYGRFRLSFNSLFWGLAAAVVVAVVFSAGREVGQRVRPALLSLGASLVFIANTPHRGRTWDRHTLCELGHELSDLGVDVVLLGLCAAYVFYVARVLPTRLQQSERD